MDSRDGSKPPQKDSLADNPQFQELLELLRRQPRDRVEQLLKELQDRIIQDE